MCADVAGLNLYLHNIKWSNLGVLLAPRTAIRDSHIELYRCGLPERAAASEGRDWGRLQARQEGKEKQPLRRRAWARGVPRLSVPRSWPTATCPPGAPPHPYCRSIVQSRNAFTIEAAPNATLQNLYAR